MESLSEQEDEVINGWDSLRQPEEHAYVVVKKQTELN